MYLFIIHVFAILLNSASVMDELSAFENLGSLPCLDVVISIQGFNHYHASYVGY